MPFASWIALLVVLHCPGLRLFEREAIAQSSEHGLTTKQISWKDACNLIGTSDPTMLVKAEETLRAALRAPDRTEEMACGLALLCADRQDTEGVMSALRGIRTVFPSPSPETQTFVTRMRLWLWLSSRDPQLTKFAASTFRELVTTTNSGALSPVDLRINAMILGTTCGMLESQLAESPIPAGDLAIAQKCLLKSNIKEVASNFKSSYREATTRKLELEKVVAHVRNVTPVVAAEEQAKLELRLSELGVAFTGTKDLALEIVRNSREIARQNKSDLRKIASVIQGLEYQWSLPTDGHPGQAPKEPSKPDRRNIHVDEYETKYEYETKKDSDGNSYQKEKQTRERRSSSDIEQERNSIFSNMMNQYYPLKADYDRRITIWTQLMKSWVIADQLRRQKLQAARNEADTRKAALEAATAQVKSEESDATADLREQRSEVEVLAEQFELSQIALQALAGEGAAVAFRPPYFDLINLEQEKLQLNRRMKSTKGALTMESKVAQ